MRRGKIVMPGGIDPHVHLKWYTPHPDGTVTYHRSAVGREQGRALRRHDHDD